MGAGAALGVELDLVDDPVRRVVLDEVRLHQSTEQRVVLPRGGGEATVTLGGGDVAAPDGNAEQLACGVDRGRRGGARFHGEALAEPGQRGGDLPACQPDERVGAEDRRVVAVEGCRRRRAHRERALGGSRSEYREALNLDSSTAWYHGELGYSLLSPEPTSRG